MEAGYETEIISLHKREIKGKHGYPIKPDKLKIVIGLSNIRS